MVKDVMQLIVERRRKIDTKLFDLVCSAARSRQPALRRLGELIAEERELTDRVMALVLKEEV